MKFLFGIAVISAFCLILLAAAPEEKSPKPQYDAKGNLLRPADYRDWEFLSALSVATIFENLEDGLTIEEIMEQFDVTREQVTAVLDFAARSLEAPIRR